MSFDRHRSCNGKKRYESFAKATRSMYGLIRNKGERELHVYLCRFCQMFHVGHVAHNKRSKHV
jgi:hypothetical protein